jgi:hypothetical protein
VPWAYGSRFTRSGGVEKRDLPNWIPASEINFLELSGDLSSNCLGAKDATFGHPLWGRAWGYRDVTFSAERLLESFPAASLMEDAVDWRHRPPRIVEFPAPVVPDGNGTMSLTAAAHWIASEGGRLTITDAHENEWLLAFNDLISAIHRAKLNFNLVGRSRHSGKYESVPATYLNDRPSEFQFLSTSARNPRLSEAPDAEDFLKFSFDWGGRHNDKLYVAGLPEWTHLQVNMAAVAASWPFDLAPASVPQPVRLVVDPTDRGQTRGKARRRGRKPIETERVKEEMRVHLRDGGVTLAELKCALEKNLAGTYRASRDTVRKALAAILSENVENSIPNK